MVEVRLSNAWIYAMYCNSTDSVGKLDPCQETASDSEKLQRLGVLIATPPKVYKE